MIHVYIDNEFDAVRIEGKYMQQVIAIGAWLCDDQYRRIDSFYSLIRPAGFYRLSPHVRRMTHLHDEEIRRASLFPSVADRFVQWLSHHAHGGQVALYSFGPDDERTLCSNAALYHHSSEQLFKGIIDLQTLLSSRVKRHNEVFQKTHSLESLKLIYRIKGDVNHNALSDAYDLCRIHEAYRKDTELDNDAIEQIYRGMKQKQLEGAQKRRVHQMKRLCGRFADLLERVFLFRGNSPEVWDAYYHAMIELAQQLHLTQLRSLRAQKNKPLFLKAYIQKSKDRLRLWLWFERPDEKHYYSIDLDYHNAEALHQFIKQWFI